VVVLGLTLSLNACQVGMSQDRGAPADADGQSQNASEIVIENEYELPITYPRGAYRLQFLAHGGHAALRWRLEKGSLPPGLKLEQDGLLHGQAERTGQFEFTVSATDDGPQRAVQKGFLLRVTSALTLSWKTPARVSGNRIDGSVEVSNTTPDDMDLTFVVLAVAGNGRATAIGYQHFMLPRGTIGKELPFGETLPRGGYIVHVDAVGEVAPKNVIYRERLQTSQMQVSVGP
jgi:hypothetical protein